MNLDRYFSLEKFPKSKNKKKMKNNEKKLKKNG
jgi:hypothetical protein